MSEPTRTTVEELLRHADWVRRLARRLVADVDHADDLAAETMLVVVQTRPRPRSARAWLATVLRNRLRDAHRADSARRRREHDLTDGGAAPSAADVVARTAVLQEVVEAVMSLREPYRVVILRRYFDDQPARVIASELGVPVSTVRTRLQRGIDRLRAELDRRSDGDRSAWLPGVATLAAQPVAASSVAVGAATRWIGAGLAALCGSVLLVAIVPSTERTPPTPRQESPAAGAASATGHGTPSETEGDPGEPDPERGDSDPNDAAGDNTATTPDPLEEFEQLEVWYSKDDLPWAIARMAELAPEIDGAQGDHRRQLRVDLLRSLPLVRRVARLRVVQAMARDAGDHEARVSNLRRWEAELRLLGDAEHRATCLRREAELVSVAGDRRLAALLYAEAARTLDEGGATGFAERADIRAQREQLRADETPWPPEAVGIPWSTEPVGQRYSKPVRLRLRTDTLDAAPPVDEWPLLADRIGPEGRFQPCGQPVDAGYRADGTLVIRTKEQTLERSRPDAPSLVELVGNTRDIDGDPVAIPYSFWIAETAPEWTWPPTIDTLAYHPAAVLDGELFGKPFSMIDADASGSYGDLTDAAVIGAEPPVPFSEYHRATDGWYMVKPDPITKSVRTRKLSLDVGTIRLGDLAFHHAAANDREPRVILAGTGPVTRSRFALAGDPLTVPAGRYRVLEIGGVTASHTIDPTSCPMVDVFPGRESVFLAGHPLVVDFEVEPNSESITVRGASVRLLGRGGERHWTAATEKRIAWFYIRRRGRAEPLAKQGERFTWDSGLPDVTLPYDPARHEVSIRIDHASSAAPWR